VHNGGAPPGPHPFRPRRRASAGDSATSRLPITNNTPGGSETQKMLRHARSCRKSSCIAPGLPPRRATC
jgi:hypothetical protein